MNKRVTMEPHLDFPTIEDHYRHSKDAVARRHWQIIWLYAQEKSTQEVTEATGYSQDWI